MYMHVLIGLKVGIKNLYFFMHNKGLAKKIFYFRFVISTLQSVTRKSDVTDIYGQPNLSGCYSLINIRLSRFDLPQH